MTKELDLKLDSDEDYLRRLVAFPNDQILAYGGDDGTLVCIDTKKGAPSVRTIRQYDEGAIRALAISSDGKRVAIGFDNGSTRLYQYNDYYDKTTLHPFVPPPKGGSDDDDDDDDNGFLSQPDRDEDDDEDMDGTSWAGPQMETAVRDLKFLPNSHWLAIATEATSGVCVVNVSSADTMKDRYLETQVEKEHDGCGIRGVDISSDKNLQLMASLALDGRLCVWKVSGLKIVTDKVPFVREGQCCVPSKDIGECNGSSPSDRSCIPHWIKPGILALPGKAELQLREVVLVNEELLLEESKQPSNSDPSKGHIQPIAAITSQGDFIVSSGQDGRVILWELQEDEDELPTAKFVRTLGTYESIPTSLSWNEGTLYMACANGSLQILSHLKTMKTKTKGNAKETAAKNASAAQPKEAASKEEAKSEPVPRKTSEKSSASSALQEGGDEEGTTKSPVKKTSEDLKRPKITMEDSEDDSVAHSGDNEKDKTIAKEPSTIQQTKSTEDDAQMSDPNDDDDDSVALETQQPSVRSVLDKDLVDSDDDDDAHSSPKKSPKKKCTLQTQDDDALSSPSPVKTSPKKKSTLQTQDDAALSSSSPAKKSPKKKSSFQLQDLSDDSDDEAGNDKSSKPTSTGMESDDDGSVKDTEEPKEKDDKDEKKAGSCEASEAKPKDKTTKKRLQQSHSAPDDDDDDDIFDVDDGAKTEEKPASSRKVSFIDDEAEDSKVLEEDEDDIMGEAAPTQEEMAEGNATASPSQANNDNHGDNDDGGFPIQDDDDDDDSTADDIAALNEAFQPSLADATAFNRPALPEPQAAFAPSSTPLDLPRRFLCWNNVGSITLISDDTGHRSTVDINFTDKAFRRPVSFTDNMGFILGSLGDDGAIFATDLAHDDDDDDLDDNEDDVMNGLSLSAHTKAALRKSQKQRMRKGSTGRQPLGSSIYFHRFETFASLREKDWYLTLPDGERVFGCACGQGWAAAVTSRKFLRIFTSGGCQGQILWLPGNPVTVVGRGRFMAVFYHESMPLQDGTQKLGYMLYDAVASKTLSKGPVCCITAGSSLHWAGFSNDCSLMAMDSDGMLSMLLATSLPSASEDVSGESQGQPTSWEWSPFLDTVGLRKSSEDGFWPITVFDGKLVHIPLKGGTKYPDAARRPITATVGMKMPLARTTLTKSSAMEELSVRSNIALTQKKVNNDISCGDLMGDSEDFEEQYHSMCAQVDKVTLKLFASIVEAGKLERALDLVDRLHLEKSYDLAMTIADAHTKLVDLIEEAKENKFPPEDMDDVGDEHEEDYEEANSRQHVNSSPQGNRLQSSSRISPETNQISKRTLGGGLHERNVRARAF